MIDPTQIIRNKINSTIQVVPTVLNTMVTTTDPIGLSEDDKKKQKLFAIVVVTCFFSFLIFVISYVSFTHMKRIRQ